MKDQIIERLYDLAQTEKEPVFFKFAAADILDDYITPLEEFRSYIKQLERELDELTDELADLENERDRLIDQLNDLEMQLAAYVQ